MEGWKLRDYNGGMAVEMSDSNPDVTTLLTKLSDTSRYGRVEVDNDGIILAFEEKKPNAGAGWINAGIYIFNTLLINSAFGRKPALRVRF